ncbi:MAG: hypothetical protein ACI9XB_002180, partial [Gammaproteobacteria bacterium]
SPLGAGGSTGKKASKKVQSKIEHSKLKTNE